MKKLWKYLKRVWLLHFLYTETHSTLTHEEFKEMWNDHLEAMKID